MWHVLAAICSNLGPSARDLVDDVHHYMEEVLWKLIGDVTLPFPRLTSAIKALVRSKPHFPSLSVEHLTNFVCNALRAPQNQH